MAKVANNSFNPNDKQNNIYKWWFEIQDVFLLTDEPFTYMNPNARAARFSLTDYKCLLVDEIEIQPWIKFRVEKALMDTIGTEDDLSCFMDFSSLFVHRKKLMFKQMDELYKNI